MISCLTKEEAWQLIDKVKRFLHELDFSIRSNIYSAVVFGSLVRGDFIPGISDIDLFVVFEDNTKERVIEVVLKGIEDLAEPYKGCSNYEKIIDIPWSFKRELPLRGQRTVKPFFKFLDIYAFDFVENSKTIFGEEFTHQLIVPNPNEIIEERAYSILDKLRNALTKGNNYLITILAGETIRLAQLKYGEQTIDKRKVLKNFLRFVPDYEEKEFAVKIWREYLTPRNSKEITKDYICACIKFIKNTIEIVILQNQT